MEIHIVDELVAVLEIRLARLVSAVKAEDTNRIESAFFEVRVAFENLQTATNEIVKGEPK